MYNEGAKRLTFYYHDTFSPDETIYANLVAIEGVPGGYPVYVQHHPENHHLSRAVVWEQSDLDSYKCRGQSIRFDELHYEE